MFRAPQYNTWIEMPYGQTRGRAVLCAGLLDAGFPPGVLTIDDRWSPDYGTWEFDTSTFADPTAMVQRPHELGFTVMLRLVPFVSPDIATFRYLRGRPRDGRCCGGSVLATTWADRCGARRGGMCLLLPTATLRVAARFVADEVEWSPMDVVFEELTLRR